MSDNYPTFDGFSLQNDFFIASEIIYRNIPERILETQKLSRRSGLKLLSNDFGGRTVNIQGYIIASGVNQLREKIDALHTNVTRKDNGLLYVESDRSATATVSNVSIADPHYAQDMVPYEIEFMLVDPFYKGTQQILNYTVVSGVAVQSFSITISGSYFAEPLIQYTAPTGTGNTTVSGITIKYTQTGEIVTWSGGGSSLPYQDTVSFDYENKKILKSGNETNIDGLFSNWDPGSNPFEVTFSGGVQGGNLQFIYQPRYL